MPVLLPIIGGILYTIATFANAHCDDFACKELKEPVKFETVKAGEKYPTK